MSVKRLLAAGVALAVLALLLALSTWSMERTAAALSDQASRIDTLLAVRSELQASVLAARAGVELSFDDINRSMAGLRSVAAAAAEARALGAKYAAVADELEQANEAQRREEAAVETFKTDMALLRLSSRYFPVAADLLTQDSAADSRKRATIGTLRTDLERYEAAPSGELAQRLEASIAALDMLLSSLDPEDAKRSDLSVMLGHTRVILDRRERVDRFTRDVMHSALRAHLEAARSAHVLAAPQSLTGAQLLRTLASLVAASGLLAFGFAAFKARRRVP